MTFEDKVRSMTAKEILGAMIAGLQREWVQVDMNTYGQSMGDICFGCAATNTLCEIYGEAIPVSQIQVCRDRSLFINADWEFTDIFESAINSIRLGCISQYNKIAALLSIAVFTDWPALPPLENEKWRENLQCYIDWHNSLP